MQKLVDSWSKVFTNQVFFNYAEGNIWCYEVEFSTPKKVKPITEGTVKCFFFITDEGDSKHDMEFNFENESLRHKLDKSMRPSMYESWIDKLLEKKLKVKTELHLGTEFELTRFVDAKGQKVDPFVPAFDIMKVQNLDKERADAQVTNVESPRFISTLKRALEVMFKGEDTQKTGKLSYAQFRNAFSSLTYGLNDNDVNMLISMADEDE